jgi:hypothetical protein
MARGVRALAVVGAATVFAVAKAPGIAWADDDRISRLERIILAQQKKLAEQEKRLKELERREGAPRKNPQAAVTSKPRAAEAAPASSPELFYQYTRGMFQAIGEEGLAQYRAGALTPVVRVILPNGTSVLVPAAEMGPLIAQVKEPDFVTEPERKRKEETAPPRRRAAPPPPRRPARQVRVVRKAPPPPPPPAKPPADDSERARAQKAQDQALLERGAILLRPGTLQIEPSFEYDKFGGNNVQISGVSIFDAIIIGTIRVDANDVDLATGNLRFRYGLTSRIQIDANFPYVYRRDREILGVGTPNVQERVTQNYKIGDIELGVSGQPIIGRGWVPNVLVRASVKIPTGESGFEIPTIMIPQTNETRLVRPPTGSGFWAAGATVTAVWAIDPVVLFAGGGYTLNFARNWGGFGRVDPGDTIQFFAGLNFALNERVSFNFSFIDQYTFYTKRNHEKVLNTQATDARAIIGTSIGLTRNVNLTVNAGIGLTSQSPRFTFLVAVPITFDVFK